MITAEQLIPYLKRIDKNKIHTNFGPLNTEYQVRLSEMFGAPSLTGSSATSLLTATLMALSLPKGSFVACPSWTFIATPAAIVMAGHIPYFIDCDKNGVALNPPKEAKAMIVVSPCGAPLDLKKWDNLSIPVIIDAAGGFDAFSTICKPRNAPVVISTHATKAFGTGEGGFVVCRDNIMMEKIRRITNFGFTAERKAETIGFNGKLSEYHAAVGLAGLDEWKDRREMLLRKCAMYGVTYATSLVALKGGEGRKNVYGCHTHRAYKEFPRTALPMTEELIKKTRFIPVVI